MLQKDRRTPQPRAAAARMVVFACAGSAGIHAGIVPEHLREEPRLGVAFIVCVLVLLATGTGMALRPAARCVAGTALLVLGGLIAAYIASRTTGIPVLAPDPEALDAVGIVAVCIELPGLAFAVQLVQPTRRPPGRPLIQEVVR